MPNQHKTNKPGSESSAEGVSREASRTSTSRKKILFVILGVFLFLLIAPFLINQVAAGPSNPPGIGFGAIQYSLPYNQITFSTSTIIVGTSTFNPPASSFTSLSTNDKLYVAGRLTVNSIIANDLTATTINGGNLTGNIDATHVTPGVFNCVISPCGGNYAFPAMLGVNTSTSGGLPAALSVFGEGYFRDGISAPLTVSALGAGVPIAIVGENNYAGGIGVMGSISSGGNGGVAVAASTDGSAGAYDFYGSGPTSYFAGKVGIGSGALQPTFKLQVDGTFKAATSTFIGQINTHSSGIKFSDNSVQTTAWNPGVGSTNYLARWTSTTALGSSTIYQDPLNNNFIGIGTSTPKFPFVVSTNMSAASFPSVLQVNGGGYPTILVTNSDSGGAGISFSNTSIGGRQHSIFSGGAGADTGGLAFFDNSSSTTRMAIGSSGNVGIGMGVNSTLAKGKLDVAGGVVIGSYAGVNTPPTNGLIVSGNVGIGTATPGTAALAVAGDVQFAVGSGRVSIGIAPTGGAGQLNVGGGVRIDGGAVADTTGLVLDDSGTYKRIQSFSEPLAINPAGNNVGIGVATPNSTLQVNGSFATKIYSAPTTYTLTASDNIVFIRGDSVGVRAYLPTAVGITGRQYIVKNIGGTYATYVYPYLGGGETIDGATFYAIPGVNQGVMVVSDGAGWRIIGKF